MFYDRFVDLCELNKVTLNKAATDIGLSNSTVTKWKKTGATPQTTTLNKISEYFNVSISYLIGIDETNTKEKAATVSGDDLSERDIEILKKVDLLNPTMQRLVFAGSVLDAEDLERLADLAESLAKAKAHQ